MGYLKRVSTVIQGNVEVSLLLDENELLEEVGPQQVFLENRRLSSQEEMCYMLTDLDDLIYCLTTLKSRMEGKGGDGPT